MGPTCRREDRRAGDPARRGDGGIRGRDGTTARRERTGTLPEGLRWDQTRGVPAHRGDGGSSCRTCTTAGTRTYGNDSAAAPPPRLQRRPPVPLAAGCVVVLATLTRVRRCHGRQACRRRGRGIPAGKGAAGERRNVGRRQWPPGEWSEWEVQCGRARSEQVVGEELCGR